MPISILEELLNEGKKIGVKLFKLDELNGKLDEFNKWKNILEETFLKPKSLCSITDVNIIINKLINF